MLLVSSKRRATTEDTGAEHLSERWTHRNSRERRRAMLWALLWFSQRELWKELNVLSTMKFVLEVSEKQREWRKAIERGALMAFSLSLAQEMLLKPVLTTKLLEKVMLRSQSRSLLPFSLKLLKQGKQDAQTNFSFLCLASAGRKKKCVTQLAPLYIILGGYVA